MAFIDTIVAAFAVDASVGAIAAGVAAVGTDLSVVGAITGNKTLSEVGGVLGLAGGVVGLATDVIGGVSTAASTVGSDADYAAQSDTAMFKAAGVDPNAAAINPAASATQSSIASSNIVDGTNAVNGAANAAGSGDSAFEMDRTVEMTPPSGQAAPQLPGNNIGSGTNTDPLQNLSARTIGPPSDIGDTQLNTGAGAGSTTSTSGATGGSTTTPSTGASAAGGATTPAGNSQSDIGKWFNGLDPQTRAAVIRTAGQGITGMVGGLFNGWTQEQKLALAQQQQAFAQQQYANAMKNASAPVYLPSSYQPATAQAPAQPAATGLLQSVPQSNT